MLLKEKVSGGYRVIPLSRFIRRSLWAREDRRDWKRIAINNRIRGIIRCVGRVEFKARRSGKVQQAFELLSDLTPEVISDG